MSESHLSDDRLIEISLNLAPPDADETHLSECVPCQSRRASIVAVLEDTELALAAEADAVFPLDRLARQRERILQHPALEVRAGRVIAFPASAGEELARPRIARRWRWAGVAAAVAASFLVGLLAEHFTHEVPEEARLAARSTRDLQATPAALPVLGLSDEEFLGQVELAVGRGGPAMLRPLDAMTPRAWDVR
jgi:hypothetical protein